MPPNLYSKRKIQFADTSQIHTVVVYLGDFQNIRWSSQGPASSIKAPMIYIFPLFKKNKQKKLYLR